MLMYSSDMKDAPQLSNNWGVITSILEYVFQDFPQMSFTSIETTDNGFVKIVYDGTVEKLVPGQTIEISGTTSYNKKYLVNKVDTSLTFAILENTSIIKGVLGSETGTFNMKYVNSPVTKLFGSAAEQKIVFKLKNGWVCRIDDRDIGPLLTPTVTWDNSAFKFARVAFAEGSDGVDILTGVQVPYNSSYPDLNINPSGSYVGNSVLPYNSCKYNANTLSDTTNVASSFVDPKWHILIDDNFFHMTITSFSAATNPAGSTRHLIFTEFDSYFADNLKGMFFYTYTTTNGVTTYNGSTWTINTTNDNVPFYIPNSNMLSQYNTFFYEYEQSSYTPNIVFSPMFNYGSNSFISGSTGSTNTIPLIKNNFIICDPVLVRGTAGLKGTIPKYKWLCNPLPSKQNDHGKIFRLNNKNYFICQNFPNANDFTSTATSKFFIDLTTPGN